MTSFKGCEDFFQEAVAESLDARCNPVDFDNIGTDSNDQETPAC
jgi:hypothetical protein